MEVFQGKAAYKGIAIGRIAEMKKEDVVVRREHVADVEAEIARYMAAKEQAQQEIEAIREKTARDIGEAEAEVFEAHIMFLDDFDEAVEHIVREQSVNAEFAVAETGDNIADMLAAMDDNPYMQARALDVKDVANRVIRDMNGVSDEFALTEPSILVAEDLTPSETVSLDKSKVLAFVTRQGSTNSHTAILARTMNIPALCQVPVAEGVKDKMAIVDGFNGAIYVDPDESTLARYRKKQEEEEEKKRLLRELRGLPSETKSGHKVKVYANIGGIGDLSFVKENDAEGVGLFRSEFLYLQSDNYPTEDEQFKAYRTVAEMLAGKEVVVRTLDIGADKQIDYFNLDKEDNPALGFRAIRICLTREEIFKTQLRALYRASAYGNINIMFPMITSVWEVQKCIDMCQLVKAELKAQEIPFKDCPLGIMIETPAAVLIADELAELVDFFSIGTNDLTQYTLAIDRQNQHLERFFDAHHPAVLKAIRMTIEAGHRHNTWVGICGELGADPELTEDFVKWGIDELSMSPSAILPVRRIIREMD